MSRSEKAKARWAAMTPEQRKEIGRKAAESRARRSDEDKRATSEKIASKMSDISRERWATMTPKQRQEQRQKIAEGHARRSAIGREEQIQRVAALGKQRWATKTEEDRKAVGQRLKEGRERWRRENPEAVAVAQAKRRKALQAFWDAASPEQKQKREERSARGRFEKARSVAKQVQPVDWKPDEARKQALIERIMGAARGKA